MRGWECARTRAIEWFLTICILTVALTFCRFLPRPTPLPFVLSSSSSFFRAWLVFYPISHKMKILGHASTYHPRTPSRRCRSLEEILPKTSTSSAGRGALRRKQWSGNGYNRSSLRQLTHPSASTSANCSLIFAPDLMRVFQRHILARGRKRRTRRRWRAGVRRKVTFLSSIVLPRQRPRPLAISLLQGCPLEVSGMRISGVRIGNRSSFRVMANDRQL